MRHVVAHALIAVVLLPIDLGAQHLPVDDAAKRIMTESIHVTGSGEPRSMRDRAGQSVEKAKNLKESMGRPPITGGSAAGLVSGIEQRAPVMSEPSASNGAEQSGGAAGGGTSGTSHPSRHDHRRGRSSLGR